METIASIFKTAHTQGTQPVSFEIFPPKGDLTLESAHEVASTLAGLKPDFISVTYSAGGTGNKQATADIASMIHTDYNVNTIAHLTCADATEESLAASIEDLRRLNICNVLALRGDAMPESGTPRFPFARNLIEVLAGEGFCVGAAAYPEGHINCISARDNIEYLKLKQDAGAAFFITQLFFDNDYYYRFWEAAQKAGVTIPITCGIMPFLSKAQIQRMVFMCGASLPSPIIKLLARYEDSPDDLRKAGIEYASKQLVDLAEHGVDGLHIYTMNQPDIARANVTALRAAWGK